ncbi:MAG: hypothetical protein JWM57_3594, partial [Phycisphaerales bacterium]|nr:hypothetical protein [Phycisphaerales bacterium]
MSLAVATKAASRDRRLDVLRGLCLFDMVLVHLLEQNVHTPWAVNEAVMHWLRFAAGGFVMTSGLCIGAIHFQRALDPAKRLKTYRSLFQRALFVLGIHYFASILTLILIPIHGQPVYQVGQMLWDVLTFHAGYDLLLFYVFMLAVSPLIIEAMSRAGVIAVLVASLGVFFWRYDNPYLSLWAIENHFPLIRWQLIFVIGMVLGSKLKAYDALPAERKWQLLGSAIALALSIDILSAAERAGFFTLPWYLAVTKMPLSLLEVMRYLSLAVAAGVAMDRAWHWFGNTTAQRILAAVGVQSLMLWVVHVPVVANVSPLPWPIAMVSAWALVWAAAVIGSWLTKQWNEHIQSLPRLAYVVPAVGSLMISALLFRMEVPRTADGTLASAEASDESVFFTGDGTD